MKISLKKYNELKEKKTELYYHYRELVIRFDKLKDAFNQLKKVQKLTVIERNEWQKRCYDLSNKCWGKNIKCK